MEETKDGLYAVIYLIAVICILGPIVSIFVNKAIKDYEKEKKKEKQFNATVSYMQNYNKKKGLK